MKHKNLSTIGLLVVSLISSMAYSNPPSRLWMTDGSPVEFSDTHLLSFVMTPEDLLGSHEYEGAVDWHPYVGDTTLPVWSNHYLSLEAEWVLIREEGFNELVDENTEVTLQGMVDTKYFSEFQNSSSHWIPASVGNNVIAQGNGIPTTIGALLRGEISATASVQFKDRLGIQRKFYTESQSIAEMPLIELINEVIRSQSEVMTHINLGAIEDHSAWVNDIKVQAAAITHYLFKCGLTNSCGDQSLVMGALETMSKMIVWKRAYMKNRGNLVVKNDVGENIGSATISVR